MAERRRHVPLLVVALVAGSILATAPAAAAAPRLDVSVTRDLDPDGQTVTVTGTGYDERKGIYVALCELPDPGQPPSPCLGGVDTSGEAGASAWISSDPPPYGAELAQPYEPGGRFVVQLRVHGSDDFVDCTQVACGIATRADHTRSSDRSQDVVVPVTFAGAPAPPDGAAAAPPSPPPPPPSPSPPAATEPPAPPATTPPTATGSPTLAPSTPSPPPSPARAESPTGSAAPTASPGAPTATEDATTPSRPAATPAGTGRGGWAWLAFVLCVGAAAGGATAWWRRRVRGRA